MARYTGRRHSKAGHPQRGEEGLLNTPPDDYDGAWKEALGEYLRECLALLFPEIHAAIDWNSPYSFLDNELQQLAPAAELGRRSVDRLVRVALRGGADVWVLIHIEVQSQAKADFAERMFVYYYRIYDHYQRRVVGLAVLADTRVRWRPAMYRSEFLGCEIRYRYPVAKLADFRERRGTLVPPQLSVMKEDR
jgi:hypothetical protein